VMRRWAIALAIFWAACGGQALSAPDEAVVRRTEIDLRKYGWVAPPPIRPKESAGATRWDLLAFDHKGRVILGFPTVAGSGLVTRERPALDFHVLRLDNTGRDDLSQLVPTNNWRLHNIFVTSSDQIVVRANDKLQLLVSSSHEDSGVRGDWKVVSDCGRGCDIFQSASRRTLLALPDWRDRSKVVVLRSDSRSPIQCNMQRLAVQSISDNFAFYLGKPWHLIETKGLFRWSLCSLDKGGTVVESELRGRVTALSEGALVVNASDYFAVIDAEAHTRFARKLQKREVTGIEVRPDETGNRFALAITKYKGAVAALDIGGHPGARRVVVYDSETGEEKASLNVDPITRYQFDFALSPDGHRVAVLVDNVLTVADVQ
jgi:hypothetical protein